jgi:predicted GTPase
MLHVQSSHVVVYVMDAYNSFKVDDFKLINRVIEEGRPVVVVVNKWESIKEQYKNKARHFLLSQLEKNLG